MPPQPTAGSVVVVAGASVDVLLDDVVVLELAVVLVVLVLVVVVELVAVLVVTVEELVLEVLVDVGVVEVVVVGPQAGMFAIASVPVLPLTAASVAMPPGTTSDA